MIKKFENFKSERSLGEWVEKESKNDEFVNRLVNSYLEDKDGFITIANAIETLTDDQKNELITRIERYKSGHEGETSTLAYVDLTDESNAGKNIFNSFLKVITALGLKNSDINWEDCPDDFIIFQLYDNLASDKVKDVMERFKSISSWPENLDGLIGIYYGIKDISGSLYLEYGLKKEEELLTIGVFKVTKSVYETTLLTQPSPSFQKFKDVLKSFGDIKKLQLFNKIKLSMNSFNPGNYKQKLKPYLKNMIITFGYFGFGKWSDGKMEPTEFEKCKEDFRNFISDFPWSDKVMMKVESNEFWVYFSLKLK